MKRLHAVVSLVVVVGLFLSVVGQEAQQQTQSETQQAQTPDELFLTAAAQGDIYEINSSQLAVERATSNEIRDFAQRMIDDHTTTTEQLTSLAEQMGITPLTTASAMHLFMIDYLSGLQDEAFDRAYLRQQLLVHQAAVNLFEMATETAQDEAVRNFATETLPILQEHLQAAQELAQQLGVTTEGMTGGEGTGSSN